MSRSRGDRSWSWSIGLAAAGLLVMAVLDFVRPRAGDTVDLSGNTTGGFAAGIGAGTGVTELYRLLPDANADLGRTVQVAGTVVGQRSTLGFWVRDLRDNIIFIADRDVAPGEISPTQPGRAVRVRGVIAVFPRAEQESQFSAAGLVLPAGATVIRDIKVTALDGGIEILRD